MQKSQGVYVETCSFKAALATESPL